MPFLLNYVPCYVSCHQSNKPQDFIALHKSVPGCCLPVVLTVHLCSIYPSVVNVLFWLGVLKVVFSCLSKNLCCTGRRIISYVSDGLLKNPCLKRGHISLVVIFTKVFDLLVMHFEKNYLCIFPIYWSYNVRFLKLDPSGSIFLDISILWHSATGSFMWIINIWNEVLYGLQKLVIGWLIIAFLENKIAALSDFFTLWTCLT